MTARILCQNEVLTVERSTKEKQSFFLPMEMLGFVFVFSQDPKQWINSVGGNGKPLEWLSLSNQNHLLFLFLVKCD